MKLNYDSVILRNKTGFQKEAGNIDGTSPSIFKRTALIWRTGLMMLLIALFISPRISAQVNVYSFAQTTATYTPLAAPTTLFVAGWDDGVANASIPFIFNFNGTGYTVARVNTNGYITFGTTLPATNSFTPISSTTAYAGAVSAFGFDLRDNASTIVTGTEGSSPNRVFVIQWNDARRYSLGAIVGDVLNFQIRLYETSNKVEIRYGTCTATDTNSFFVQSGLRGATNADFSNRTTNANWAATSAGTANTDSMITTNAIMPSSGLTFTWTRPPACSGAPNAGAVSPASSTACPGIAPAPITVTGQTTGVSGLAYLWQESDDNGVTDPWANAVGGSGNTTLTYSPPVLTSTKYYRLRIVCNPTASFSTPGVITLGTCAAPANDNPCGAVTLTGATTCTPYSDTSTNSTTNIVNATTTSTNGVVSPTCSGAGGSVNDVWFKFTATATTHGVTVAPVAGFDVAFQLYNVASGTCGGSNLVLNPISCTNTAGDGATEQNIFGMTVGQDYYLRVYRHPSGSTGSAVNNSQFSICVFNPVPACTTNASPANLATNIGLTPTLTWAAANYADSYDIYLGTTSGPATLLANSATNSYTLTAGQALNSITQYYWYVVPKNASGSAVCGAANETSFTTLNNCTAPTNPTSSAVTHNSATVSWTAASPAPANGYVYEIRTSGTAGSGSTGLFTSGTTVAGDTNDNLVGLAQATTYNLYVRSRCSVSDFSEWTAVHQFTTGQIFPPVISSFFPTAVCSNGSVAERTVIITGSNFTGVTAVTFNGTNAQSYNVDSSAQITAVVSSASTTGNIAITNADGTGTSTNALTVNNPPVVAAITAPGGATMACIGTALTLSDATPSGVWSSSNQNIATINNSGTLTPVAVGNVIISYTVTNVSTGCTSMQTYALAINAPVSITSSTATQTIAVNTNTSFSVTASGTGNPTLTYQWQVCTDGSGTNFAPLSNAAPYSGVTTSTLSVTNAPLSINGSIFRCVVTGICGAETSDNATLFVGETTVTQQPQDVTLCDGGNTSFTITASADTTAYQWQVDQGGNNWQNISNGGIYSGATTAALSLSGLTIANNGWRYRCQATGLTADVSDAATLTINQSVNITTITPTQTIAAGTNTSFTVAATGTGLSYQWQVDSGSGFVSVADINQYSGSATATLSIANAPLSFNGYLFRCLVTGTCNAVTSNASALFVGETTVTQQPQDVTLCDGGNTSFTITASADTTAYQWQVDQGGNNWQNISNGGIYSDATTATLSLSGLTIANNGWRYRCQVTGLTADVSDAATLTINQSVNITSITPTHTIAAGTNTAFTVAATGTGLSYQWQVDSGSGFSPVADVNQYSGSATATLLITNAPLSFNGYFFRCLVTGTCNAMTSNASALFVGQTAVVDQPEDITICDAGNAEFTITASADTTAYQWQEDQGGNNWQNIANGGIYSGATTATLSLSGLTISNNGWRYRCEVTGLSSDTSNTATLTVNQSVNISASTSNQTIGVGDNASFSVTATGTALAYQWEICTDGTGVNFTSVTNANQFSGATTASLSISNASISFNGYIFRCVVTNGCGAETSDNATLFVGETTVVEQPQDSIICSPGNASFTIVASADTTAYQWQQDQGGNNWQNISNGGIYSGANTATLTLSGLTNANNGWRYRCAVTGLTVDVSDAATLTVNQSVAINSQPDTQTVCASGGSAQFNVSATGGITSYQWQYSADNGDNWNNVADNSPAGATYSGANSASLNVTTTGATPSGGTYSYRALVNASSPCAAATSNAAQLNINSNASTTWYVDADGDGYGDSSLPTILACSQPDGYAAVGGDCNDAVGTTHPNAIEIPFNGADDNCDGNIDETGTVTTSLLPAACGATLNAMGSLIGITTVAGQPITGYRIRATNGAQVQVIETNVPHFTMPQFASYTYATTYTIEIQLQRAGLWQASWGPACSLSTPAVLQEGGAGSINPSQCGITLARINTLIATTSLAGVTGYRFRLTNLTDPFGPNAVQVLDRPINWFSLQMLTRYNYGTTYSVEVAIKTTAGFGPYGAACEVSSPAAPILLNCGGVTIPAMATAIGVTSLPGAMQYRYQVVRESDGAIATLDRNTSYFTLSMFPTGTITPGALYYVRAAVMTTGTWSPFGDACEFIAPGGASKGIAQTTLPETPSVEFKVAASPNPFTTDFNIDVVTSSQENVQLKVYDMVGKLVDTMDVKVSDIDLQNVGAQYPSGVYTVIVTQGEIVKTVRVIKR